MVTNLTKKGAKPSPPNYIDTSQGKLSQQYVNILKQIAMWWAAFITNKQYLKYYGFARWRGKASVFV